MNICKINLKKFIKKLLHLVENNNNNTKKKKNKTKGTKCTKIDFI